MSDENEKKALEELFRGIAPASGSNTDTDEAMVFRSAKRVGRLIAVLADEPPPIDDYMDVVRRGLEAGYAENAGGIG